MPRVGIRQEKLEQLARRFDRKAAMRETWLNENQRLVVQVVGDALAMAGAEAFWSPQRSPEAGDPAGLPAAVG